MSRRLSLTELVKSSKRRERKKGNSRAAASVGGVSEEIVELQARCPTRSTLYNSCSCLGLLQLLLLLLHSCSNSCSAAAYKFSAFLPPPALSPSFPFSSACHLPLLFASNCSSPSPLPTTTLPALSFTPL